MPGGDSSIPSASPGQLSVRPNNFRAPVDASRLDVMEYNLLGLQAGNRVRATISWAACSSAQKGTATQTPSMTDLDLFLYNTDARLYVWASQSVHDNNEGFDFKVATSGNYKLILTAPAGVKACDGSALEAYGFAYTIL